MDDRIGGGFAVRSWLGDATAWPEAPLEQGPIRISGTVLDPGATWYVTRDRLGWSTVALVADENGEPLPDLRAPLREAAARTLDPARTARHLREVLGARAATAGVALARVGPYGTLVELLNVSLPTVLVWHPLDGLSPYEPAYPNLARLDDSISSEIVRLRSGGLVALTTGGVLPSHASWHELRAFAEAMGIDPFGGTLAQAPPLEIARLLRASRAADREPRALVVVGLPSARVRVA